MSEMTKKAWAEAVALGCLAGASGVACLYSLAMACVVTERHFVGVGWAMAGVLSLATGWVMFEIWRVLE